MSDLYHLLLIILVNVLFYGLIVAGIVHLVHKRSKHPQHAMIVVAMILCFVIFTASIVQKVMYHDWTIDLATLAPMMGMASVYFASRREKRLQS